MNILITGALGYIGCELLYRLLLNPSNNIYAVDNDVSSIKHRLGGFLRYPNLNFINADITSSQAVKKLPKVDLIVHLAAVVGYITCNDNKEAAFETNVQGTRLIAALNAPIIFLSTGSVYGEIGDTCDETVHLNPKSYYAETKILGEEIIRPHDHVILRPSTAYGISFKVRHDLLAHTLALAAIETKQIDLYQPYALRSFYSVQKIAELLEYIIFNFNKFKGITLNVGCESGNVRKIDVANTIANLTGAKILNCEGHDLDSRDYNVNFQRLKSRWPLYQESFDSQIKSIVEYYKTWAKY